MGGNYKQLINNMDPNTLSKLGEYGIGIFAIAVLGYILFKFIKSHQAELNASREERQASNTALMSYVESNNHQKTAMIEKHTTAMVSVGKSIETNTKVIERLADKL